MPSVPDHRRLTSSLPPAASDYFAPETESITAYLDTVPETVDPADCDAAVGPIQVLPWLYVADLTGWRGGALARILAAERDCPCYRLSGRAGDALPDLWSIIDESGAGPVVLHVELIGEGGPIPATLQAAVRRGYDHAPDGRETSVSGEPTNLHVVFTDTAPSKRLSTPLPDATAPMTGAVLSYAPRDSMLPELPDGTAFLDTPPAIHDRETALEAFLTAALDGYGNDEQRAEYVETAIDILSITHSVIGKRDLLFDVSPRVALRYGGLLDELSVATATARLRTDVLGQVPRSPGSEDVRATLEDLLPR